MPASALNEAFLKVLKEALEMLPQLSALVLCKFCLLEPPCLYTMQLNDQTVWIPASIIQGVKMLRIPSQTLGPVC